MIRPDFETACRCFTLDDLAPMQPSPFDASGRTFFVVCRGCGADVSSNDVSCDTKGRPGDFYCQNCAVSIPARIKALHAMREANQQLNLIIYWS